MFHHFPLLCDVSTNLEAWAEAKPLKMYWILSHLTWRVPFWLVPSTVSSPTVASVEYLEQCTYLGTCTMASVKYLMAVSSCHVYNGIQYIIVVRF